MKDVFILKLLHLYNHHFDYHPATEGHFRELVGEVILRFTIAQLHLSLPASSKSVKANIILLLLDNENFSKTVNAISFKLSCFIPGYPSQYSVQVQVVLMSGSHFQNRFCSLL